jgi:ribosomal peptide maturation radical SAM protein 1
MCSDERREPAALAIAADRVGCCSTADVVLISMPFGPLLAPSIALGLLKASLAPRGISAKTLYFGLWFAEQIGTRLYRMAAHSTTTGTLAGEWIFASALFPQIRPDTEGYLHGVLEAPRPVFASKVPGVQPEVATEFRDLLEARGKVDRFLDDCLERVVDLRPRIVGFTSVFLQHVASLALAKRLKARAPDIFILIGGANCEGVMGAEVIRQFPFVDAVVSGEGDLVFPDLVERILAGNASIEMPGVYTQGGRLFVSPGDQYAWAPMVRDMDALPVPDYDEFFEQSELAHLDERERTTIQFETSRGCWWGERHHCTFCGLNGATMTYRSKSSQRALDELVALTDRYPGHPVAVVDNILDHRYFKDFMPALAARRLDLELFYEVKANLKKAQVRLLRDAGIRVIQPGIESFSTRVLDIMRKGERGLHNIQLLKWCKELGVTPVWNLLWGFPGEPPEEYRAMADLLPLLTHLAPPISAMPIRLDRFSPNFDQAEALGFTAVEPLPAYRYIYPFQPQVVANLAYYFSYSYRAPQDVESYTRPVEEQVYAWRVAFGESDLFSIDLGSLLLICDLRPMTGNHLTALTGLQRALYLACDAAQSLSALQAAAHQSSSGTTDVEALLQPLLADGLMVREGYSYLSLAVPVGEYSPSDTVRQRFRALLDRGAHSARDRNASGEEREVVAFP